jgi:DNA-binding SARP family transcriptional activator
MMASLHIHLFEHLQVSVDDRPLSLKFPPRTVPLWAYLLLQHGRMVKRLTLVALLWPDVPETEGRANLRRHLHQLQHRLPVALPDRPWLLTEADDIGWNTAADYWLDVLEFERLSANPETLDQAVALYRGDLLRDLYDDWLIYERERLRSLYFDDLYHLITQHRARRDFGRAITYATQLLARDPLREDALRQLMALRYESGDRSGALQEYERYIRRLRAELAVDPMPETIALYEAVLRNTRLPDTSAALIRPQRPHEKHLFLTFPFAGRESEMRQLRQWWDQATQDHGQLIAVHGEAGIGKTRLLNEFAASVESQDVRVLRGETTFAEPIPYQALVTALRSGLPLLAALELDPIRRAVLATLIPELAQRYPEPLTPLPALSADQDRLRLFEAIAYGLSRLAKIRPVLIVLEDVHTAGASTMALLEFLARQIQRQPILLIVTYREEEVPRTHPLRELRRRLQAENLIAHLPVPRLTAPVVHQLIQQVAGSDRALVQLADRFYRASEGNPFFLLELLRDLGERRHVRDESDRQPLAAIDQVDIPAEVQHIITARLQHLSPQALSLAELVAVIGTTFDVELVREASGWNESDILECLDELLDYQVVREAAGSGRFHYAFTHELFQAALYQAASPEKRRQRHRRIAHVLEELNVSRLDEMAAEIAQHFDRGGEAERAAHYDERAARYALAVNADEEALSSLDRGLELAADERLRFDLLALREIIHARRGERTEQAHDLERLNHCAQVLNDEPLLREVLRRQILFQHALGKREAEAQLIARLQQLSRDDPWRTEVQWLKAAYQVAVTRYAEAQSNLEAILPLYRSRGDRAGEVACLCLLTDIAVQQGRFADAQTLTQQAIALPETHTNQTLLVQTLRAASAAAFAREDFAASQALAGQMLEVCQTMGDRSGMADAHLRLGTIAMRFFRIEESRTHYHAALQLYTSMGNRQRQAAALINAGMLAVNLGRYDQGIESFRQAARLFEVLSDVRGQAIGTLNLSYTALAQGNYALAHATALRSLELTRQMNSSLLEASALANLGAAERELGQLDQAIVHMEAGLALRRTFNQPAELGTDLCDLTIAYLRANRFAAAQQSVTELLELNQQAASQMLHPQYILWVAAQTDRAGGDTVRAVQRLHEAHAVLQQRAAAIPDLESRTTFLNLSFNREIQHAYSHDVWPW